MNTQPGLIGRKLGCTQLFDEDGNVQRVTAIEVGPCLVATKKTQDKDGYWALQLGFGEKPVRLVKRPQLSMYEKEGSPLKKKGLLPRKALKEVRTTKEFVEKHAVGQSITLTDIFEKGQYVDVSGTTKGKGFAGVVKRHGFHGGDASHGTHEYFRHGGSVGQNMTPGRTFKGMKMPGHMGNARHTTQNLQIVDIIPEENIMLVKGSIPGARKGLLIVRRAVKKSLQKRPSAPQPQ
jgi:large subunit ribosomal protein L3